MVLTNIGLDKYVSAVTDIQKDIYNAKNENISITIHFSELGQVKSTVAEKNHIDLNFCFNRS